MEENNMKTKLARNSAALIVLASFGLAGPAFAQNKPDIGVNIARQWIDADKVDAIADTPNSGVALAVSNLVKEKNAVHLNSGAATADLTGKACNPNTISFTYDTYMLAN